MLKKRKKKKIVRKLLQGVMYAIFVYLENEKPFLKKKKN